MVAGRVKDIFHKYGRVAVAVHLSLYCASLAGIYAAVKSNVDVEKVLVDYHLLAAKELSNEQEGEQSWFRKKLSDGSSAFLIAFICNKATMPVRAPMTVGLTPIVAKFIRQYSTKRPPIL